MRKALFLVVFASGHLFAQDPSGSAAASSSQSASNMQNWIFGLSGLVLAAGGLTTIIATTGSTAH